METNLYMINGGRVKPYAEGLQRSTTRNAIFEQLILKLQLACNGNTLKRNIQAKVAGYKKLKVQLRNQTT